MKVCYRCKTEDDLVKCGMYYNGTQRYKCRTCSVYLKGLNTSKKDGFKSTKDREFNIKSKEEWLDLAKRSHANIMKKHARKY